MIRRRISLILAILTVMTFMIQGSALTVFARSGDGITTDISAPPDDTGVMPQTGPEPEPSLPNTYTREEDAQAKEREESLYTKTIDNGDGTKTLEVYGTPVRYRTEDGSVKDISLTPVAKGKGFTTGDHRLSISFPEKADSGISLDTGKYVITATPVTENGTAVKTASAYISDSDAIVYRCDPKTSYEYNITYSGYKENIVVSEYTGQTDFLFRLETDGLKLSASSEGSHGSNLVLSNNEGTVVANIGDIIVFTSDNRSNTFGEISYETVTEGSDYILRISLSAGYLSDPDTHYPIYIDPTITVAYNANNSSTWNDIEDITVNQNAAADSPSHVTLYAGKGSNTYGAMRAVMRFPDLNLYGITPSSITSAKISMRDVMCYSTVLQIDCYGYGGTLPTGSFTTSNMTWSGINSEVQYYESSGRYRSTNNVGSNNGINSGFWYEFDILPVVREWAQGTNAGTLTQKDQAVVFKSTDTHEQGSVSQYVCFGSFDGSGYRPYLTILYNTLTLDHSSISIGIENAFQLSASVDPSNLTVTWSSSDSSVAYVTQSGLVCGVGLGTTTITAQCSGASATCTVTVIPLSEGVYRIFNWNTLESMKVERYGISNCTNVLCSYDLRCDCDETMEKNSLWLLTHLSNNAYTLRPVHKPNLALNYTSSNVDVYGIGIDYSFSLDSTRWTITASNNSFGYILQNDGQSSRTLARDSTTGNVCIVNGYSGSPNERWGFVKLTNMEVDSIKGIIVYGNSTVKVASNIQLTAGVFSPNSLSQSVSYTSGNGYYAGSVSSSGLVTGNYSGKYVVIVTSNVDLGIIGYANLNVVSQDRQAASLVGIYTNEIGHDHTSFFTPVSTNLTSIFGTDSAISTINSVSNGDDCVSYIANSNVFVFRGHGEQDGIYLDDTAEPAKMFVYSFGSGEMRILSDSDLVLYCCCSCGEGGVTANNLVVATYNEGAKNVIGFTIDIYCGEANDWLGDFFTRLAVLGTIDHATINQALNDIGQYYVTTSVSNSNILFMYN